MPIPIWQQSLVVSYTDGSTITGNSRTSCIPAVDRIVLPNHFFYAGKAIKIQVGGRISCAVTTPGTARFDICLGVAGTTVVFDTGAIPLNIVAKENVPFHFEVTLVCRAAGPGTATTFIPMGGKFQSEAVKGSPLPSVGGNGSLLVPVGAPAVGGGTDATVASTLDVFFTQTVTTGSMTVHTYQVDAVNWKY